MCFIPPLCLITQEQHYQLSEADVLLWRTATPQVASIHLSASVAAGSHSWTRTIHLDEESRSGVRKMVYGVYGKWQQAAPPLFPKGRRHTRDGRQWRDRVTGLWHYWHHWHTVAMKSAHQHWNANKEVGLPSVAPAANRSRESGGRGGDGWWRESSQSVLAFVAGNKCQRTADAVRTAEIYHRSLKPCLPRRVVLTCPLPNPFFSASSEAVLWNTFQRRLTFKSPFKK